MLQPPHREAIAVILGSAFHAEAFPGLALVPQSVETPWGKVVLHRVAEAKCPAFVLFRHGLPHRYLPNQIPYRAQAWALAAVGCGALLVTSSVGVLDPDVPLYRLLRVMDLLMPENRLPDGTACTMFVEPTRDHGHLVLSEGLFSKALSTQVAQQVAAHGAPVAADVVFAYAGGPRTKTPAENRMWAQLGGQVNSMTLGPEVVLANELGIPTAALVVGHKYSVPDHPNLADHTTVAASLDQSRAAMRQAVSIFLEEGAPVPFGNHLFRFGEAR